jgi:hypothetical protein
MYVGVVHTIQDRDGWEQAVQAFDLTALPEGVELLATGTSGAADRAICLWRAPSVEAAQGLLDGSFGRVAVNDCFAVAEDSVYVAAPAESTSV